MLFFLWSLVVFGAPNNVAVLFWSSVDSKVNNWASTQHPSKPYLVKEIGSSSSCPKDMDSCTIMSVSDYNKMMSDNDSKFKQFGLDNGDVSLIPKPEPSVSPPFDADKFQKLVDRVSALEAVSPLAEPAK